MKKLITLLAVLFSLNANALELSIYQCSVSSNPKLGALHFIDLDVINSTRTGYEVIEVFIYHRRADFTFCDTITLASVFVTDFIKPTFENYKGYKRLWFNLPEVYNRGSFFINVKYCKTNIGYFMQVPITSIEDEYVSNTEPIKYFTLDGKEIKDPIGYYIEVKGNVRRKIYKGE